ncbi:MAG: hypothetical protein WDW36_002180 [Sanguina aurantia]
MSKGGDGTGDGNSSETNPSAVAESEGSVLEDQKFVAFNVNGFDVAAFTSQVLAGSHITAQAQSEQLREGVIRLERELCSEVKSRNKELLHNVRRMLDTQSSLQDVVGSVESLQQAVRRIRAEVVGPYEQIKSRSTQLRNLHATIELLRHVIHHLKLTHKLRQQMAAPAGSLDLAKAAKLLSDIRSVETEVDLSGVQVVAAEREFIAAASKSVRQLAEAALLEGMESLSQAKVGSALQVFFNLDELQLSVTSLMSKYLSDLERSVRAAVDSKQLSAAAAAAAGSSSAAPTQQGHSSGGPGGARGLSTPSPGASAAWQEKLWSGLREVSEQVLVATTAVWHLQRVVSRKKDPLTHVCFLDVLVPPDQPLLAPRFWSDVVRVLQEALATASKPSKGGFVRDMLTVGYPRLAALLEAMFERLSTETTMKGVPPAVVPAQLQQLLAATSPFQNAYLAACLSRMSEAVVAAFPGQSRSLPSPADVQKCIAVMHEELKVAGSHPQLAAMIASTTGKALKVLADKAEFMAATGSELRAIGSTVNAAQARNIALCSQLQEVHRSLCSLLPRLPATAAPALATSLDMLHNTAVQVISPLFKAAMELIEERLMHVHSASRAAAVAVSGGSSDQAQGRAGGSVMQTSSYIGEVSAFIALFRSEYLSRFVPPPSPNVPSCVSSLAERMACRILLFWVRHAALLRPLTQDGKLQLAKDLAELQLAVGTHLSPLDRLGSPSHVVKAFRALLFVDTPAILGSPLLQDLPPAIALHHLFSRLPPSVKAPHERSGLSPSQFSLWLDTHSSADALRSVSGAIECAEGATVRQAGGQGAEVLDVMRVLCEGRT